MLKEDFYCVSLDFGGLSNDFTIGIACHGKSVKTVIY